MAGVNEDSTIGAITVQSFGAAGLTSQQAGSSSLVTDIDGSVTKFTVKSSIYGATLNITKDLASLNVGNSLYGGTNPMLRTGAITVFGNIGKVTIGDSLVGNTGVGSGSIHAAGSIGSIKVGGSLQGGGGFESGSIVAFRDEGALANGIGGVKIGGSLVGSTGESSGSVRAGGILGKVTVGGSLLGGDGPNSGALRGLYGITSVKITGSVLGGDGNYSGSIDAEVGRIGSITVGGSISAGSLLTGSSTRNGIFAGTSIGTVKIAGSLTGFVGDLVNIVTGGTSAEGASPVVIQSLSVGGSVVDALVLAGYNRALGAANADVQIGKVTVGGDWIASSLVAGVQPGTDAFFGNDAMEGVIAGGSTDVISSIASVVIKGQVRGTTTNGADSFAFTAERIGSFKVSDAKLLLTLDKDDILVGPTGDVRVREV